MQKNAKAHFYEPFYYAIKEKRNVGMIFAMYKLGEV